MNDAVRKIMKFSYLAGALIAGILLLRKEVGWASGLMIGIIWSVINFSLTINLFEIALLRKDPKRMTRMLMIKFPVLYLAGFFILTSKLFPLMSIVTGIGLALFIIGIVHIWPKQA